MPATPGTTAMTNSASIEIKSQIGFCSDCLCTKSCFLFRKDHVRHEKESSNLWPQNWSFLKGCYEEVGKSLFPFTNTIFVLVGKSEIN